MAQRRVLVLRSSGNDAPAHAAGEPLARGRSSAVALRRRQARAYHEADLIHCLPGRTKIETMKVGHAARRLYLHVLWLFASWSLNLVEHALTGAPMLALWSALVHLKTLEDRNAVLDAKAASWIDAAFWEGGTRHGDPG